MAHPSFTLQDAKGVIVALCLLLAIMTPLGYWLASFLQSQKFNQSSLVEKFLQATTFACAFGPIFIFLLWRINFTLLACAVIFSTVSFLFSFKSFCKSDNEAKKSESKFLYFALIAWALVAFFTIIDFQWGENLYMSVVCFDYEKHVSIVQSIMDAGVPPVNPMFFPGHPLGLYYYYFWFTLPALAAKCSFHQSSAYASTIAGTIWTGIAFIGLFKHIADLFFSGNAKMVQTSIVLLMVSGLDVLLVAPINIFARLTNKPQVLDSVEWWSLDQVSAFVEMLLWVPHHLTGCIAVFIGIFLFLSGVENKKWLHLIAASICFASAAGSSVYLFIVGTASLCVYMLLLSISKKEISGLLKLVSTLGICLALASPFFFDLHNINAQSDSKIRMAVRSSGLIRFVIHPDHKNFSHTQSDQIGLAQPDTSNWSENLLLLLLNYPFELGFYFLAAMLYWWKKPVEKKDWLFLSIFGASLFIATFFRSTIHNNDLGWRGLIPAQIVLLFWAADYLTTGINFRIKKLSSITLTLLLLIGTATSLYDLYLLRFSQLYSNRDLQENDPKKNYAIRLAYQNIVSVCPQKGIIQANPMHARDPFMGLYSQRQTIASDQEYGPLFGVDLNAYRDQVTKLMPLFNGGLSSQSVRDLCDNEKIFALVIKWSDPVFNDKSSWVSELTPFYQNEFVKVFVFDTNHISSRKLDSFSSSIE
ncbi:MAG: hypothetical protein KIT34_07015 [Cyanobacteria bacterium TGS_CYA1]|nr:hypothetical protein [Cyanobacteria bacterium TGS_CYA1]